jgi:hypothetical protein
MNPSRSSRVRQTPNPMPIDKMKRFRKAALTGGRRTNAEMAKYLPQGKEGFDCVGGSSKIIILGARARSTNDIFYVGNYVSIQQSN